MNTEKLNELIQTPSRERIADSTVEPVGITLSGFWDIADIIWDKTSTEITLYKVKED